MCGCSKINGMARRRKSRVGAIGTGDIMTTVTEGAMLFAGFAAANLINKNVSFLNTNPLISSVAQIGLGVLTPTLLKSRMGNGIGLGMAVAGFRTLIVGSAPSVAEQIGIAGIDYSMPPNPLPMVSGLPASVVIE